MNENMEVIILLAALIFGAAFMFAIFCIADMAKDKKPRKKVHFYIRRGQGNRFTLWVGKTVHSSYFVSVNSFFKDFNLSYDDFTDMKEGEIREVFVNSED